MNEQDFALVNPAPAKPKPPPEYQPKARQNVLFSGLNLLPGQQDLFPTDGVEKDDVNNTPAC